MGRLFSRERTTSKHKSKSRSSKRSSDIKKSSSQSRHRKRYSSSSASSKDHRKHDKRDERRRNERRRERSPVKKRSKTPNPLEAAEKLKERLKKELAQAEKCDVALKDIKDMKQSLFFTKDIKIASDIENPYEKARIMETLNANTFTQTSFSSSRSKAEQFFDGSTTSIISHHESAMFGPGYKVKTATEIDLSSITLPKDLPPPRATSALTDPKMLINSKFHVSKEEKMLQWFKYLDQITPVKEEIPYKSPQIVETH